jgi:branched-chain amino acid transport system permease protein
MKTFAWIAGSAAALAAAIAAPFFLSSFAIGILTTSLNFAIFAVSLNIILGHGGLVSLGHAVFLGIGAYTVGLLVQKGFNHLVLCILAGTALSIVVATLIGPIVLRTREVYFLMVTLAIGEVLRNLAINWRALTSGDDGISGLNAGVIAGIDFSDGGNFYFISLSSLVLTLLLSAMLMNSPFGYALRAQRENRSRLSVLGVRPLSVQLTAYVIAAGIAGFAGGLFAYEKAFVSPTIFSVEYSAQALLMVVMGGAGTLFGPVVGAFVVEGVRGIGSLYTDRWQTVLGLLAVIVALISPQVLRAGLLSYLWPTFLRREQSAAAPAAASCQTAPSLAPAQPVEQPVSPRTPRPRDAYVLASQAPILRVDDIAKSFGGLSVLNGVSFSVNPGERRGLIGPNGAGKTTLLNILSGIVAPTSGTIHYASENITALPVHTRALHGIGRTFQIGNLFNDCTVRQNVQLALVARDRFALRLGRPLDHYSALREEAQALLDNWQLHDVADILIKSLSYGQRRIIEIVVALATKPKLLLLDEPAAGLSGAETKAIIETISSLDPDLTILIIEHDMDLIFSICDRVTVVANGKVLAEGTGDEVRRNPLVIDAYLGMPL